MARADAECRRRMQMVSEAAVAITSELSLDKVLQKIVDSAREILDARYAALGMVDEERRRLTSFIASGLTRREIAAIGPWPRGLGLLGLLMREPKLVRVKNIAQDFRSIGFPPNHPAMTSFMGVPVVSKGRILGSLYITDKIGQEEFGQDDEEILVLFAAQAAVAIENARLYTETSADLENKVRQLAAAARQSRFLAELGGLLPAGPLTGELPLQQIAQRLTDPLGDACGIYLVDERDAAAAKSGFMFHANPARRREAEDIIRAAWPWLKELVITKRRGIVYPLIDGIESAPGAIKSPTAKRHRFTGILAAPIITDGKCYGMLVSLSSQPFELTHEDLKFASLATDLLAIAIDNTRLFTNIARSEARLAETERTAHIGSFETEYLGQEAIWSEETYRIFGRDPTKKAPSAAEYMKLVHQDDRQWLLERVRRAHDTRTSFSADYRIITPDGIKWVYVVANPLLNREGPLRFFGTIMDITERKKMEEALEQTRDELQLRIGERTAELQKANELLRETNQQLVAMNLAAQEQTAVAWRRASELEATIQHIADGVFICDRQGQIVDVNGAGLKLIGLAKKREALRPLAEYLVLLHLRDAEGRPIAADDLALSRALRGEIVVGYEEAAKSLQDQRDIYLLVSAAPIRDRKGDMIGAVETMTDITQLRQLDKLKDDFISVAAHELKTPITIMKGHAQVLLRTTEALPAQKREMLNAIDRGADRIDRIVRDLLDISRLHVGRLELTLERIDLSEMIDDAVRRMAAMTTKHRIIFAGAERVFVEADRARLEQVLINLLDNAIKYSPEGGDIDVALSAHYGEAIVSVKDHGIGIPWDRQQYIFERFYRAHTGTPYDYGGMGVGLHISREIISRHDGRMWFQSTEGKGSTFYFSLPLKER